VRSLFTKSTAVIENPADTENIMMFLKSKFPNKDCIKNIINAKEETEVKKIESIFLKSSYLAIIINKKLLI